jgi:hypothetical protein
MHGSEPHVNDLDDLDVDATQRSRPDVDALVTMATTMLDDLKACSFGSMSIVRTVAPHDAYWLASLVLHVVNALAGPHGTYCPAHHSLPWPLSSPPTVWPPKIIKEPAKLANVQMLVAVETLRLIRILPTSLFD